MVIFFRPNIFLHLEKITENVTEVLQWLPGHFKEDPKKTRKMILYVRSINTCQQIFNWILDELQDKIFCGEKIPENRIVEMFHASTDEESNERIMESFICPSGQLKLLISTVAFGMGVNIPDVDLVLHWGIPPSSLSYWQEIGRCARDGRDGYAICYAFKRSISKCNSDDLKNMLEKDEQTQCIRKEVLRTFKLKGIPDIAVPPTSDMHENCNEHCSCSKCQCCIVCLKSCKCANKLSNPLDYFLSTS